MHKSTVVLGFLCLVLVAATGLVLWQTLKNEEPAPRAAVEGTLQIGLAGDEGGSDSKIISADSAVLWDTEAQVINFEKNAFERRPIASITKLMTAMVALDFDFDWDKEVAIEPNEYVIGGQLLLAPGEFVTMRDLFNVSLISSANNTTLALVRGIGVPGDEFVQAMNRKAIELGMEQTEFFDVTGLDPDNVSSAYEVARMAEAAWRDYPIIAETTSQVEYSFVIGGTSREHTVRNSNKLVSEQGVVLTGGKTGYLYESGYCLVVQGSGINSSRVAVVLSSPSEWDNLNDIKRLLAL